MSIALVIIAVVAAVTTVVATDGILSVKPAYAIDPVWGGCSGSECPGASGFTPGYSAQIQHVPANEAAPGLSSNLPPGIALHTPQ